MKQANHTRRAAGDLPDRGRQCGPGRTIRITAPIVALIVACLCSCQGCRHVFDMEPQIAGNGEMWIEVVFHPGASLRPTRLSRQIQEALVERGYTVVRAPSNPDYELDQERCDALVVISPVYGSTTRRDLRDFLSANAPYSVPIFAALTGFFQPAGEKRDLPILNDFLEEHGAALAGGVKISTLNGPGKTAGLIAVLCDQIDQYLSTN